MPKLIETIEATTAATNLRRYGRRKVKRYASSRRVSLRGTLGDSDMWVQFIAPAGREAMGYRDVPSSDWSVMCMRISYWAAQKQPPRMMMEPER